MSGTRHQKHPVQIGVGQNPIVGAWDLQILVGNFANRAEAEAFAERVANFLREEVGATLEAIPGASSGGMH